MRKGRLKGIIDAAINVSRETSRDYIGASQIGDACLRRIWYNYHGVSGAPFSTKQQRTFSIGKKLETIVIDSLHDAGVDLILPHVSNHYLEFFDEDIPYLRGHADAIIKDEDAILEIKTAKDSSFKIFVNKGLKVWNFQYYTQIQCYMGMSHKKKGYIVCINKDTSEVWDEEVQFSPEYYDGIKARALLVHSHDEPLPKVNDSPFYYACKTCQFKEICHD